MFPNSGEAEFFWEYASVESVVDGCGKELDLSTAPSIPGGLWTIHLFAHPM